MTLEELFEILTFSVFEVQDWDGHRLFKQNTNQDLPDKYLDCEVWSATPLGKDELLIKIVP